MAARAAAKKAAGAPLPTRGKKQTVGFGLVSVAVQLKPLIEPKKPVSANIIDRATQEQIKTVKVLPSTGAVTDDTVKGYKQPDGSFVVLDDDAVEELVAEKTGQLQLERVVDVGTIDPLYFGKSFLVYPGEGAGHTFDVLAAGLREAGKAAVGTAVLAKQTQNVVLRWSNAVDCMVAHVCHFDSEVRWADVGLVTAARAGQPEPSAAEIAMAGQLLGTLEGEFDPAEVEDTYYPALLELIEATAAGKPFVASIPDAPAAPVVDLMAALEASVAAAGKAKKPAAKKKVAA